MPSSIDGGPLGQWQTLWGATYAGAGEVADPRLNLAGWVSSYTGTPIRPAEMKDWVEQTVARIRALSPRRVLEIGCGMGLLLLRVAPHCEEYLGLDFTPEAVAYVAQCLASDPIPGARVERRSADDLADLPAGHFDVIVLNSVIQYFPGRDYLMKVLAGAMAAAAPGARCFVGDIRSQPHLPAFHTAVQLAQADPPTPIAAFKERVEALVAAEPELVFVPSFFSSLSQVFPRVARANVQVKRGRPRNELTRFRYDVVLHLDAGEPSSSPATWLTWGTDLANLAALKKYLTDTSPDSLGVRGIPNARLAAELKAVELLYSGDGLATVSDLEAAVRRARPTGGVDPEDLYVLEKAVPYRVEVTWSEMGEGLVDAVFHIA